MPPVYVTRVGLERLDQRLNEAIEKLRYTQSQKADAYGVGGDNWHDNFAFEELGRQEVMYNRQITDIRAIQNRLVLVEAPSHDDLVQIGHIITLEDEDGSSREFRVGGYGETDMDRQPPTLEYGAPIVLPFMSAEVGTEAKVLIKGKETMMALVAIRKE